MDQGQQASGNQSRPSGQNDQRVHRPCPSPQAGTAANEEGSVPCQRQADSQTADGQEPPIAALQINEKTPFVLSTTTIRPCWNNKHDCALISNLQVLLQIGELLRQFLAYNLDHVPSKPLLEELKTVLEGSKNELPNLKAVRSTLGHSDEGYLSAGIVLETFLKSLPIELCQQFLASTVSETICGCDAPNNSNEVWCESFAIEKGGSTLHDVFSRQVTSWSKAFRANCDKCRFRKIKRKRCNMNSFVVVTPWSDKNSPLLNVKPTDNTFLDHKWILKGFIQHLYVGPKGERVMPEDVPQGKNFVKHYVAWCRQQDNTYIVVDDSFVMPADMSNFEAAVELSPVLLFELEGNLTKINPKSYADLAAEHGIHIPSTEQSNTPSGRQEDQHPIPSLEISAELLNGLNIAGNVSDQNRGNCGEVLETETTAEGNLEEEEGVSSPQVKDDEQPIDGMGESSAQNMASETLQKIGNEEAVDGETGKQDGKDDRGASQGSDIKIKDPDQENLDGPPESVPPKAQAGKIRRGRPRNTDRRTVEISTAEKREVKAQSTSRRNPIEMPIGVLPPKHTKPRTPRAKKVSRRSQGQKIIAIRDYLYGKDAVGRPRRLRQKRGEKAHSVNMMLNALLKKHNVPLKHGEWLTEDEYIKWIEIAENDLRLMAYLEDPKMKEPVEKEQKPKKRKAVSEPTEDHVLPPRKRKKPKRLDDEDCKMIYKQQAVKKVAVVREGGAKAKQHSSAFADMPRLEPAINRELARASVAAPVRKVQPMTYIIKAAPRSATSSTTTQATLVFTARQQHLLSSGPSASAYQQKPPQSILRPQMISGQTRAPLPLRSCPPQGLQKVTAPGNQGRQLYHIAAPPEEDMKRLASAPAVRPIAANPVQRVYRVVANTPRVQTVVAGAFAAVRTVPVSRSSSTSTAPTTFISHHPSSVP